MEVPTALERRIAIRSEFAREATVFTRTDGVMHEIALERCNRLLDEYLIERDIVRLEFIDSAPVEPLDHGETV